MTATPQDRADFIDIGITSDFLFEGGAETVVDAMCAAFPKSTVYTTVFDPAEIVRYPELDRTRREGRLRSSLAQWLTRPVAALRSLTLYHFYWLYFPIAAFQRTKAHDVVLVSCCAQSKLIRIPGASKVIVYFHTPTRWLYPGLMTEGDLAALPGYQRGLIKIFNLFLAPLDKLGINRLRKHDPVWLCNSTYVRDNIERIYGVRCNVLYPPVDLSKVSSVTRNPEDFFLYHGRLTFQKRVDVAIRGCLIARKRLVISGQPANAQLQRHLERIVEDAVAQDPSLTGLVTFLGRTSDTELLELLATAAGLIFPPREDFGITPIEAIAAGVPVIAFGEGGALDYIRPKQNGVFFREQNGESLAKVLEGFDPRGFDPNDVRNSIPDLSSERFKLEISALTDKLIERELPVQEGSNV